MMWMLTQIGSEEWLAQVFARSKFGGAEWGIPKWIVSNGHSYYNGVRDIRYFRKPPKHLNKKDCMTTAPCISSMGCTFLLTAWSEYLGTS